MSRKPMHTPVYLLGGLSLTLALVVTIFHGICYASFKALSSETAGIEAALVGLNAVSCVILLVLILLWTRDIQNDTIRQWTPWKTYGYGLILAYLLVVTGITAGGIAWSASQLIGQPAVTVPGPNRSLMVARCVVWAMSVLSQGVLGGYLLLAQRRRHEQDQRTDQPSRELGPLSSSPSVANKSRTSATSSLADESRRTSLDPKSSCEVNAPTPASRVSHRYSGRTLYQPDGKLDLLPAPPAAAVTRSSSRANSDRDSRTPTVVGDDYSERHRLYRSNSELKRSLDSLVLQSGTSSPTASSSTTQLDAARLPLPKLRLPADESDIHPLFRSDSPSPPPTPTPTTIVVACPAAGQTISVKTLERVRSTRSLRSQCHTPRSRSPLFERMDVPGEGPEPSAGMPGYIMAAHLRKSIAQYEKRYDLHESPHES
ncbi:predicted protein [Aspergillus terreus NIH2624]|uniref:Uncharacterized protein n=1 Tax=Aspergillus terreus (strain NIH 2624 / FGSC A1156) TaxID=341663 RepID=Q0CA56_ASPTN|nr:uncharacterized protein ATEG_09428 [Aspergillus terreus NIH2624]EAU30565.1 predicted protein [Aspergillus terreus NIH2624]